MVRRNQSILLLALIGGLASCAIWAPGKDPRGRRLIASGDELVAAVESYHQSNGRYPASLQELPGDHSLGEPGGDFHFSYQAQRSGYNLRLNYTPSWPQSGRVDCFIRDGAVGWGCDGYL